MSGRSHVTFSHSAEMNVKQALARLNLDERVISQPDDLGYGPIEPFSLERRAAFERDALDVEVPEERLSQTRTFWDEAVRSAEEHVVWISSRCVRDLTGTMELISRCTTPPLIVDIANTVFVYQGSPRESESRSLGALNPDRIVEYRLLEQVSRMSTKIFESYRARWAKLKKQNAPLRVFDEAGVLVSAPVTHFDEFLISCAADEWVSGVRVIADAIVDQVDEPYVQNGDYWLINRMHRLITEGLLEGKGNLSALGETFVRRPRSAG